MTQLTDQDLAIIKELINSNTRLILEKMETLRIEINAVSEKVGSLDQRVQRLEANSDKVTTAIVVAMLTAFVAIVVKSIVTFDFFGYI